MKWFIRILIAVWAILFIGLQTSEAGCLRPVARLGRALFGGGCHSVTRTKVRSYSYQTSCAPCAAYPGYQVYAAPVYSVPAVTCAPGTVCSQTTVCAPGTVCTQTTTGSCPAPPAPPPAAAKTTCHCCPDCDCTSCRCAHKQPHHRN